MDIYQKFLIPMLKRLDKEHHGPNQPSIPPQLKQVFVDILTNAQEILQQTFETLISSELG